MLLHHHSLWGVQEKEEVSANKDLLVSCCSFFYIIGAALLPLPFPWIKVFFCFFSMRQYTVPDPPGLFDGHVWPMYLKHRKSMEDSSLNIGMLHLGCYPFCYIRSVCFFCLFLPLIFKHQNNWFTSCVCAEYLDGLKQKEEIYNQVYEDIQNNLLNRL